MAVYSSARPTLSFHLSQPSLPIPRFNFKPPVAATIPPLQRLSAARPISIFTLNSIDVSKEDKPTSDDPNTPSPPPVVAVEKEEEKFDKRRLEERFAVLNTGIYECRSCGHKFDEAVGDPTYPIAPGLPFEQLPEDWRCPTCGAAKSFFESKSVEIAGFAQNQQYGLGGNTLTSGQKAVLIYGSLLFFFALFLSGYFLQ
ncbi:rubredoxin [Cucumis melo var. makuwa]|nr:rubredoxin [Cucumis melo subsp. melo]KAA0063629.1 rubredoxin [Cucumis melo var. makuwa]TYK18397.1 rubredoxin [Cucumis melo var. makuwa]